MKRASANHDISHGWGEHALSLHGKSLSNPAAWYRSARELSDAAALLVPTLTAQWEAVGLHIQGAGPKPPEITVAAPFLMLCGMALEALCKAAKVSRWSEGDQQTITCTGRLPADFSTHASFELLKSLGVVLSEPDEICVLRLERAAIWAGRYPVPMAAANLAPVRLSTGSLHGLSWSGSPDVRVVPDLMNRLAFRLGFPPLFERDAAVRRRVP